MSNHDVKCRFCGEVTGINYDVCQDCEAKELQPDKVATISTDDIPFE